MNQDKNLRVIEFDGSDELNEWLETKSAQIVQINTSYHQDTNTIIYAVFYYEV